MGLCQSCLGRRQSSSDDGDLDRILDSQLPSYGTIADDGEVLPDEEELQREREALDNITSRAGDDMIDVRNATFAGSDNDVFGLSGGRIANLMHAPFHSSSSTTSLQDAALDEAAWLESLEAAQKDTILKPPEHGTFVLNLGLLRENAL